MIQNLVREPNGQIMIGQNICCARRLRARARTLVGTRILRPLPHSTTFTAISEKETRSCITRYPPSTQCQHRGGLNRDCCALGSGIASRSPTPRSDQDHRSLHAWHGQRHPGAHRGPAHHREVEDAGGGGEPPGERQHRHGGGGPLGARRPDAAGGANNFVINPHVSRTRSTIRSRISSRSRCWAGGASCWWPIRRRSSPMRAHSLTPRRRSRANSPMRRRGRARRITCRWSCQGGDRHRPVARAIQGLGRRRDRRHRATSTSCSCRSSRVALRQGQPDAGAGLGSEKRS